MAGRDARTRKRTWCSAFICTFGGWESRRGCFGMPTPPRPSEPQPQVQTWAAATLPDTAPWRQLAVPGQVQAAGEGPQPPTRSSRWPVCGVAPGRPSDTGQGESRHPPHGGMLHGPPPGRGFTRRQLEGGRGQRDRDGVASDNGPVGRKDRGAVLGSRRRGRAGRGAAARVHVGVGALDGRPAGALHGHRLLVGAGLPAARALPLHGLGLRGVPGTHSALRARPPPGPSFPGPRTRQPHLPRAPGLSTWGLCHPGLGWL